MFRSWHIRSLLPGFVVALCAMILLAVARNFLLSPRHVFMDGSVLKFEKVTLGTRHVFSQESRLRGFLREEFSAGFPQLFAGRTMGVTTTTAEPSLVIWLLHDNVKPREGVHCREHFALVADEHGHVVRNEIRGWGERWPNRFAALSGYPKTFASFPVVITDDELRPIWQFTVKNPQPIPPRGLETAAVHD
jgi:hypothetical protein